VLFLGEPTPTPKKFISAANRCSSAVGDVAGRYTGARLIDLFKGNQDQARLRDSRQGVHRLSRSRPEVDPNRVAILGISMAVITRRASQPFDKRLKALVAWKRLLQYILEDLYDWCEHLQPVCQRLLGGVSHDEARKQLKSYTMAGIAKNITCPTLITHGSEDRLMRVDGAKKLFEEIGAEDKTLKSTTTPMTADRIHCSHDYWTHNVPYMLDWLEERL